MKNNLIIIVISLLIFSCEETIQLDLEQTEPQVVIEGLITNHPVHNYVKLSQTTGFNEAGFTKISGASVVVTTDENQVYPFEETAPGYYTPVDEMDNQIGQTFYLSVEHLEKTYMATEQMPAVSSIDSLTYAKVSDVGEDDEEADRFYEMYMYTKEPQDTENYYLFKFYRNEEILDDDGTTVYIFDDVILNENIDGIATPGYYALGDTGRVEVFGVTRQAYRYYLDLSNNLNNDGGIFSGIPANAGTNIQGGAIGYFQVSAMEEEKIVIE